MRSPTQCLAAGASGPPRVIGSGEKAGKARIGRVHVADRDREMLEPGVVRCARAGVGRCIRPPNQLDLLRPNHEARAISRLCFQAEAKRAHIKGYRPIEVVDVQRQLFETGDAGIESCRQVP